MAEKVKTKCPLCGDVLSAGGYEAKFSADIGATCFRLFYKPLNAEILRTPNGESQRNTNVYLFGNPILFPPNRIRGGRFVSAERICSARERTANRVLYTRQSA